jgi:hypothetical protein
MAEFIFLIPVLFVLILENTDLVFLSVGSLCSLLDTSSSNTHHVVYSQIFFLFTT